MGVSVSAKSERSVRDIFEDAQTLARGNIETIASPLGGVLHMAGIVPRLTVTPGVVRHAGPLTVGEHNEEVYCGWLGLRRQELDDLQARGMWLTGDRSDAFAARRRR